MASDEDREFAAKAGALPPGHEQYDYDGDESLDIHTQVAAQQRVINHLAAFRDIVRANLIAGNFTKEELLALAEEFTGLPENSPSTASEAASLQ